MICLYLICSLKKENLNDSVHVNFQRTSIYWIFSHPCELHALIHKSSLKKHHCNASEGLEILILTLNNTEKSFLQKILDLSLLTSMCVSSSARQVWLEALSHVRWAQLINARNKTNGSCWNGFVWHSWAGDGSIIILYYCTTSLEIARGKNYHILSK